MEKVQLVFYVSMLTKFVLGLSKILSDLDVEILKNLSYVEQPVQIVDTQSES